MASSAFETADPNSQTVLRAPKLGELESDDRQESAVGG
jgi:hypothetical protein